MLLLAMLLAAAPGPRAKAPLGMGRSRAKAPEIGLQPAKGKKRVGLLIKMGRFVQAEEILASVAEPSSLQRFQHSQALVGMGRCTQGEALLPLLSAEQQGLLYPRLATCYLHHQQWHRAAEWLGEAAALHEEEDPGRRGLLWLALSRSGEEARAQAMAHDEPVLHLMAAKRALDLGEIDAVDQALAQIPVGQQDSNAVHLVNAQAELDLGNLAAAEAHAKAALESGPDDVRAMALLAESRRRSGWGFGAAMTLKRKPLLVPHHPLLRAVAIRIAVDAGELSQAQALLQAGLAEGFVDAELYASAWYLHQHLQDGQAALWAQRWAAVNTSPLRSLEQL